MPHQIRVVVRGWCEHYFDVTNYDGTVGGFIREISEQLGLPRSVRVIFQNTPLPEDDLLYPKVVAEKFPTVEIFVLAPVPLLLPTTIALPHPPKTYFKKFLEALGYYCFRNGEAQVWGYEYPTQEAFILNPKAEQFLDNIQETFAVINTSGTGRSGQSTFLTYLMHSLNQSPVGSFETSDQDTNCTFGIWMWPELITWLDPKTNLTRKILLLDSEGLFGFDPHSQQRRLYHPNYSHQLFTFGCMISSLMIFNTISLFKANWEELRNLAYTLESFSTDMESRKDWEYNRPNLLYVARRHHNKNLVEDKRFWKSCMDDMTLTSISRQVTEFFKVTFHASFLSLPELPPNALELPQDHVSLEPFQQKVNAWVNQKLSGFLPDFSVRNPPATGEENGQTKPIQGLYFQIVQQLWKIVLSSKRNSQNVEYGPVRRAAAEGEIMVCLEKELRELKKFIDLKEVPCPWKKFEQKVANKKAVALESLRNRCHSKRVPLEFIIAADLDIPVRSFMELKKKQNEDAVLLAKEGRLQTLLEQGASYWTVDDTHHWALSIIPADQAQKLKNERIDGRALLLLSYEDISRCGLLLGPARILTNEIEKLKPQTAVLGLPGQGTPLESFFSNWFGGINWVPKGPYYSAAKLQDGTLYDWIKQQAPGAKIIEAIYNPELMTTFIQTACRTERNRLHNGNYNNPPTRDLKTKDFLIKNILKQYWLPTKFVRTNIVFMWHGTSQKICQTICENGIEDLRTVDGGYFGAGIYLTPQFDYAKSFSINHQPPAGSAVKSFDSGTPSTNNGMVSVVLCAAVVGLTYAITLEADCPNWTPGCHSPDARKSRFNSNLSEPRADKAILHGFDSHFVAVGHPDGQVENPLSAIYHELVLRQNSQVLPIAIIQCKK